MNCNQVLGIKLKCLKINSDKFLIQMALWSQSQIFIPAGIASLFARLHL